MACAFLFLVKMTFFNRMGKAVALYFSEGGRQGESGRGF